VSDPLQIDVLVFEEDLPAEWDPIDSGENDLDELNAATLRYIQPGLVDQLFRADLFLNYLRLHVTDSPTYEFGFTGFRPRDENRVEGQIRWMGNLEVRAPRLQRQLYGIQEAINDGPIENWAQPRQQTPEQIRNLAVERLRNDEVSYEELERSYMAAIAPGDEDYFLDPLREAYPSVVLPSWDEEDRYGSSSHDPESELRLHQPDPLRGFTLLDLARETHQSGRVSCLRHSTVGSIPCPCESCQRSLERHVEPDHRRPQLLSEQRYTPRWYGVTLNAAGELLGAHARGGIPRDGHYLAEADDGTGNSWTGFQEVSLSRGPELGTYGALTRSVEPWSWQAPLVWGGEVVSGRGRLTALQRSSLVE
jgi:hypothetical protein